MCQHKPLAAHEHVITINNWEVNKKKQLGLIQRKISQPTESAGRSCCCIFQVPQFFINVNGPSYEPQTVSIGPYHHGKDNVKKGEEIKLRFLYNLLKRTEQKRVYYKEVIKPLEMKARDSYSEAISLDSRKFVEMLVLDGCFIIEIFRMFGGVIPIEKDDPLLSQSWFLPSLLKDLIRLENQIPFFILQSLYEVTNVQGNEPTTTTPSLAKLVLDFFNYDTRRRPDEVLEKIGNLEVKHLLDFLRSSYTFLDHEEPKNRRNSPTHDVIQCISKLRRTGIKFRPRKEETFLAIKFNNGFIEMPKITIDGFMSSFLVNCVAYEQCHVDCSKHMTTYATLLHCLVKKDKDVEYLSDCDIIENRLGSDAEVAKFINNLGKEVMFDIGKCYLLGLFNKVNDYYKKSWRAHWTSFKYTYCTSSRCFIPALVTLVLMVFAALQGLYAILGYYHHPF